jgi:hypothetical protein
MRDMRRLRQLPYQGMLASTRTDDQHFHFSGAPSGDKQLA